MVSTRTCRNAEGVYALTAVASASGERRVALAAYKTTEPPTSAYCATLALLKINQASDGNNQIKPAQRLPVHEELRRKGAPIGDTYSVMEGRLRRPSIIRYCAAQQFGLHTFTHRAWRFHNFYVIL